MMVLFSLLWQTWSNKDFLGDAAEVLLSFLLLFYSESPGDDRCLRSIMKRKNINQMSTDGVNIPKPAPRG